MLPLSSSWDSWKLPGLSRNQLEPLLLLGYLLALKASVKTCDKRGDLICQPYPVFSHDSTYGMTGGSDSINSSAWTFEEPTTIGVRIDSAPGIEYNFDWSVCLWRRVSSGESLYIIISDGAFCKSLFSFSAAAEAARSVNQHPGSDVAGTSSPTRGRRKCKQ